MHIAVLGAGIAGITTAYYLSQSGHSVTVVDEASRVASGATGGNGCQLSYSYTDAFANPALLRKLPHQILGLDPAIRVRPTIDRHFARWGLSLLRQCTRGRATANTASVHRMAMQSAGLLADIRDQVPLEFAFRKAGKLVLLSNDEHLRNAEESLEAKKGQENTAEIISFAAACDIEPALHRFRNSYQGAVWSVDDEVGCARRFCEEMSQWLMTNRQVDFRLGENIEAIEFRKGTLKGIKTSNGVLEFDAVIVCLGALSPKILEGIGVKANIYPVRGYSVTLPPGKTPASTSITDLESKIVFSRIGDKVRIAGLADIVGYRTAADSDRIRDLVEMAHSVAPQIADYVHVPNQGWGGFRPMTPDSRPLVGQSQVEGVYLNTGHGMLGWTLACASGFQVAGAVNGMKAS